jgi:hypothetical protein
MADYIGATPQENPLMGLLAERLKQAQQFAAKPFGYSNPPAEMLMNLLGVPAVQQTAERLAYGEPMTTGRGMTTQIRPEVMEAAMTVAPSAGLLGRGVERGAMAAGRAGERYAEKVVPQIMERGGLPAQLLGDLSQGSVRPIQAWHGSGKLFPEFDVTRNPEQGYAYTRGSYAAAAKREAEGKYAPRDPVYEEKLMGLYKAAEKKQDYDSMEVLEAAMLHESPKSLRETFVNSGDYDEKFAKKASSIIDKIDTFPKESYLYKLDIADEALPSMLQYDNPISQQSKEVKAFAKELGLADTDLGGDIVGKLIAQDVTGLNIQEAMKKRGIPGLIYNSPDVQGSVNYVTYDPSIYKILEINDKPYEQWFPRTNLLD